MGSRCSMLKVATDKFSDTKNDAFGSSQLSIRFWSTFAKQYAAACPGGSSSVCLRPWLQLWASKLSIPLLPRLVLNKWSSGRSRRRNACKETAKHQSPISVVRFDRSPWSAACIRFHCSNDICLDLLLSRVFAQTRVSETLLEQYLTFAVTGVADLQHNKDLVSSPLISPETFLLCLFKFVEETVTKNPYQWSHILKLLPAVLTTLDADQVISDLLNQEDEKSSWSHILSEVFIMLSRIVAVGLYRDYYISNKENVEEATTMNMDIAPSFGGNTQPNGSSLPFNFLSQASAFDPDATIYFDNLQDETSGQRAPNTSSDSHSIIDTQSTLYENDKIETSNAILAAQIMVELIEKKSAKRIFEVMNNQQRRLGKADLKAAGNDQPA